jgi:hypothetical protein
MSRKASEHQDKVLKKREEAKAKRKKFNTKRKPNTQRN